MLKKVIIGRAFIMSILTLSVLTFWGCTTSNTETTENTSPSPSEHETVSEDENIGSFEYEAASESENIGPFGYETVSEDENTCRIIGIHITKKDGISELKIPGTINGKTVISIGLGEVYDEETTRTMEWNAFFTHLPYDTGDWISYTHLPYDTEDWTFSKKQARRIDKIKKIILPDTIQEIRDYAFAGLDGLESVELPESLTTIGDGVFLSTSIKKMHLPSNLTTIGKILFSINSPIEEINIPAKLKDGVPDLARLKTRSKTSWKNFTVSEENPYYKIENGKLYSKDERRILYAMITSQ